LPHGQLQAVDRHLRRPLGLTISQGAIANVLAAPATRIAEEVRASEVIASDETSARVAGKTRWQWGLRLRDGRLFRHRRDPRQMRANGVSRRRAA
jgi:hypothetical protein